LHMLHVCTEISVCVTNARLPAVALWLPAGFKASVRSFTHEFVFNIQCSSHVHLCYYRCPFCLPRYIDWYSRFLVSSSCWAICKVACIKLRLMCVLQLYKGDGCVWSTLSALGSHCYRYPFLNMLNRVALARIVHHSSSA
jgi:hypothetical protein